MLRFRDLRFLWHFGKARSREISGDYGEAIRRMNLVSPSPAFRALRDVYHARLVALLRQDPAEGLAALASVKGRSWFIYPTTESELYAKVYCEYFEFGLKGLALERDHKKDVLLSMDVSDLYRSALRVT